MDFFAVSMFMAARRVVRLDLFGGGGRTVLSARRRWQAVRDGRPSQTRRKGAIPTWLVLICVSLVLLCRFCCCNSAVGVVNTIPPFLVELEVVRGLRIGILCGRRLPSESSSKSCAAHERLSRCAVSTSVVILQAWPMCIRLFLWLRF